MIDKMADDGRHISPLKGNIVPVRTVQEANPEIEFADAYVALIKQKCAAQVAKLIDSTYPKDQNRPFTHLRRFAKEEFLPEHLKVELGKREPSIKSPTTDVPTIFVLVQPPLPELSQLKELLAPFVPSPSPSPSSTAEPSDPPSDQSLDQFFFTTTIPLNPPLSAAQADHWSKTLWPTAYNAAFARAIIAPPPPSLNATKANIAPKAAQFLGLACEVAREAKTLRRGRAIGVVVVDPAIATSGERENWEDGIVAVAGDARFCVPGIEKYPDGSGSSSTAYDPNCEGGPELHAIMRVVEMIAIQRRSEDSEKPEIHKPELTPLETQYLYNQPTSSETQPSVSEHPTTTRILPRSAGGYLCTDLDIYITHEPCLSCSMGVLLSRFRAVTFLRRGRLVTGGLASEPLVSPHQTSTTQTDNRENYYGLFWRKELNWRAMCFEFVQDNDDENDGEGNRNQLEVYEAPGNYHA